MLTQVGPGKVEQAWSLCQDGNVQVRADMPALSDSDPKSPGTQLLMVAARGTTLQRASGR